MSIRIGINGFGRIGRLVFRAGIVRDDVEIVAVNAPDKTPEQLAYATKYDSVHGRFNGTVEVVDGNLVVNGKNVKLLKDGVMIDNQVLINYIVNNLGGVVGEQYAAPQGRITIKTAASDVPTNESEKVIAGRDTTVTEGDTYTVVAGDCLWNIAYKLYGTGTLYTKLAEANKLADPYIIYIGQILTVPAK